MIQKSTIQKFLDNGFTVAAFSMPLIGLNNQPVIELENIGEVKFFKHNQFVYLESENFSSMSYFFTPISVTLNHLSNNWKFTNKNNFTEVTFDIDFEIDNKFLNVLMEKSFEFGLNRIADAFQKRAEKLFSKS